jgi:hypothetical protein
VTISLDSGAWLGSRDGSMESVFPFSHTCRRENWQRLMKYLRALSEIRGLQKVIEARLREYRLELKGLGVGKLFKSLPVRKRIIG